MTSITVRVPVRADLAGGTLDLWPLYLFHPGARTVNVAVSFHAECTVESLGDSGIEVRLEDNGYNRRYDSAAAMHEDPQVALLSRAVEHFHAHGIRITTKTDAPRGSGLGGSSALAIALVSALSEFVERPLEGELLINTVRDLETRLIGVPAGVQDYYPPVFGGLASLHLEPGCLRRVAIPLPLTELSEHFVLHYSGVSHFSGTNNWEIFKRQLDGDETVRSGLRAIAGTAAAMEEALSNHDLAQAGRVLGDEWKIRKELIKGISTPEIDAAVDAATSAGAWGGKVCGAGGGGCIVFLTPPDRRAAVLEALKNVPGRTLSAAPVGSGLEKSRNAVEGVTPRRRSIPSHPPIEHLYLASTRRGKYQPNVLATASVTFSEPRAGLHMRKHVTLLAPVTRGVVDWKQATRVHRESLKLSAVPAARREFAVNPESEDLRAAIVGAEEGMRQQLEEEQRFSLYYNPAFNVYSEPGEDRADFIERCRSLSSSKVDDERERLESTFRRRIDQLRERQQKEDREYADDSSSDEVKGKDVNIAWGQTLYRLTTGRAAAATEPASPREGDYLDGIALLQKQWKRELENIQDDLSEKAKFIEEIGVAPSKGSIQVEKVLLVWAVPAPPAKPRKR